MGFTIYIDESCGLVLNQNCKAITASDVVISTRKCNGVTNLSWFSLKMQLFIRCKKTVYANTNTMCPLSYSYPLRFSASVECIFILDYKSNEKLSELQTILHKR